MSGETGPGLLDGAAVLELFESAARHLRAAAPAIDAINVYPVPDGDTGSNMAATLEESVSSARVGPVPGSAREVLAALATGALYGARGNSGVILSQALRGMANAATEGALDGPALAHALEAGATAAYSAVSRPVEGTMLTVLRAAGVGAKPAAPGSSLTEVLRAAVLAAEAAEALTPTQLPLLAEAGVTDSGGEGVCVILRGLLAGLEGGAQPGATAVLPLAAPLAILGRHGPDEFGFCTEFLVDGLEAVEGIKALREIVAAGANRSVVVVGDAALARVHVHTDDPEALVAVAAALGRVSRVKIEDMDAQRERFGATGSGAGAGTKLAVLALAPGPGFESVFAGLGARTLALGAIAKPSAGDLAAAADALHSANVILLPNHPNVLMAAAQAVALARCALRVVPSRSAPQGIAATLAFDARQTVAGNVEAMTAALAGVKTVEVTRAAASRAADGVPVRAGDHIALLDGRLVAAEASTLDALLAGLAKAGVAPGNLVTMYRGADVTDDKWAVAREMVLDRFPVELEVLSGGQDLYDFIASVE